MKITPLALLLGALMAAPEPTWGFRANPATHSDAKAATHSETKAATVPS